MKRILVAEDRPASRELIRTIIEASGYELVEAENGREAMERAANGTFDLILLDLQMPEIDGFGVLTQLRQSAAYRHTPIVALTASAMHGDRERALAAGFSAYIPKPVDLNKLRTEIKRLIGGP
ncbi:MAG: response regulator [Acidobacteriaceae bacterium]|nr:response regulator [Acidobacteriaceae bacterium]